MGGRTRATPPTTHRTTLGTVTGGDIGSSTDNNKGSESVGSSDNGSDSLSGPISGSDTFTDGSLNSDKWTHTASSNSSTDDSGNSSGSVSVHRCSCTFCRDLCEWGDIRQRTTIGVTGYRPWFLSTSRSLIDCSRRGCRRPTSLRISRSLRTLHPSRTTASSLTRIQTEAAADRRRRTRPRRLIPSTQTPIDLVACMSRSLSRSVRTSGSLFHSVSLA